MNIIAFDIASEVSNYCIMRENGRIIEEDVVLTRIMELKRIIKKIPRPRQVVFEECSQAAWLYSELNYVCNDVFVCNGRKNRKLSGEFKNDVNDARNLAKRARMNELSRVWHGGDNLRNIKEALRCYQVLTEETTRLKNQIKSVFRSNGICVGQKAYAPIGRKKAIKDLKFSMQQERVTRLGVLLDAATEQKSGALKSMVKCARRNEMYAGLRKIDGIGPIFASIFISEVGDPHRFRTRSQLYSYAGLAVTTHDSSEHKVKNGKILRKNKPSQTRGLVREYNHPLKYMLKQATMILSRTKWKTQYQDILTRTKNSNMAQLTLARKLACVMLRIAKSGERYDIKKVFKVK